MGKLEEKIALITGGNSGIGLATAKRFVNEGAYVFITGRREPELAAAVKEIGKNVTAVAGDASAVKIRRSPRPRLANALSHQTSAFLLVIGQTKLTEWPPSTQSTRRSISASRLTTASSRLRSRIL
jgi:NAD(P)-dependent dehydrogenase (short-subunit alcohol dehydrogenase family)